MISCATLTPGLDWGAAKELIKYDGRGPDSLVLCLFSLLPFTWHQLADYQLAPTSGGWDPATFNPSIPLVPGFTTLCLELDRHQDSYSSHVTAFQSHPSPKDNKTSSHATPTHTDPPAAAINPLPLSCPTLSNAAIRNCASRVPPFNHSPHLLALIASGSDESQAQAQAGVLVALKKNILPSTEYGVEARGDTPTRTHTHTLSPARPAYTHCIASNPREALFLAPSR